MNNQPSYEDLSALMDGEAGRDSVRFLLRRLDRDATGPGRWDAYHLAQASLRHSLPVLASKGFAEGVAGRIRTQPVQTLPGARWLRWSARGAIAAAVAVAALVVMPPQQDIGSIGAEASFAAAPAPSWLNEPAQIQQEPVAAYRMIGNRNDALAWTDPMARVEAGGALPQEEGVLPYLLSTQNRHRFQAVDAADR